MFNPPTIEEATQFALDHRGSRAFVDYEASQISAAIFNSILNGHLLYEVESSTGKMDGLLLFWPNVKARLLFIDQMVCTSRKALIAFIAAFERSYGSDFRIAANRKGRLVIYDNTEHFTKLLTKYAYGRK